MLFCSSGKSVLAPSLFTFSVSLAGEKEWGASLSLFFGVSFFSFFLSFFSSFLLFSFPFFLFSNWYLHVHGWYYIGGGCGGKEVGRWVWCGAVPSNSWRLTGACSHLLVVDWVDNRVGWTGLESILFSVVFFGMFLCGFFWRVFWGFSGIFFFCFTPSPLNSVFALEFNSFD